MVCGTQRAIDNVNDNGTYITSENPNGEEKGTNLEYNLIIQVIYCWTFFLEF